jgi:hypothetical protein
MPKKVVALAAQTKEADPAETAEVDEIFQRMLQVSKPKERAKLNAKTPEERRKLVNALDDSDIRQLFPKKR